MEASLLFPFTQSQMKELERQTMIYKNMMASVPVPPHLLQPILPSTLSAYSSSPLLSNKDVESRRCKKTDGKKWRCNRDVASPHNYRDRHLSRLRPRSRKPVEDYAPFTKKTRIHLPPPPSTSTPMVVCNPTLHTNNNHPLPLRGQAVQPTQAPLSVDRSSEQNLSASLYQEPNGWSGLALGFRRSDWMMKGDMVTKQTSRQLWQHLMQINMCNTSARGSGFQQLCSDVPPNVTSYAEFGAPEFGVQNGDCHLLPNSDLQKWLPMETPTSTGFTGGYTNDNTGQESSVSAQAKHWPSSPILAMAMAAGNALDEEMSQLQVGLGVADSDHCCGLGGASEESQVSSWLGPVSRSGFNMR